MTTIPEPKYKVKKTTLEEIDKRDRHEKGLCYLSDGTAYRPRPQGIIHLNGSAARHDRHWPANGSTHW